MHRISLFVELWCTDSIPCFAKYVIFLSSKMCHDLFIINDDAVVYFISFFAYGSLFCWIISLWSVGNFNVFVYKKCKLYSGATY